MVSNQLIRGGGTEPCLCSMMGTRIASDFLCGDLEVIVSKRLSAPYRSGPSRDWLKVKNPDSPAMIERAMSCSAKFSDKMAARGAAHSLRRKERYAVPTLTPLQAPHTEFSSSARPLQRRSPRRTSGLRARLSPR
jgi:hypothetical protein